MAGTATTSAATRYMQGIEIPATSIRPVEFFAKTRRKRGVEVAPKTWAGFGGVDTVELKKSDIIAGAYVRVQLNFTTANGTGAVVTTGRWPYDIARVKFTANGQSNLINASALKLKAREFMSRDHLSDRGVSNTVGGATKTQGTLSLGADAWGVGSNSTVAPGTYDLDVSFYVPIAEDQVDLTGAIFAANSATDLTLSLEWQTLASLFTLTGTASVTVNTGKFSVETVRYAIPKGDDGELVVPDLTVFHSVIESSYTALQNSDNEIRVTGQGAGKQLLRLLYQVWNGATTPAPLAMTDTNYGRQAWRYSGNETPDEIVTGGMLRAINEREYGVDIGGVFGFGCHDFAAENAFRDAVDMGQTSDLRLFVNITSTPVLASARLEYAIETVYQAGAGA